MLKSKIIILSALLPLTLGSCGGISEAVIEAPCISEMDAYCKDYPGVIESLYRKGLTLLKPSDKSTGYRFVGTSENDVRMADSLGKIQPQITSGPAKTGQASGDNVVPYRIKSEFITYYFFLALEFYIGEDSMPYMDLYVHHLHVGAMKTVYSLSNQKFKETAETFDYIFNDYASRFHTSGSDEEGLYSNTSSEESEESASLTIDDAVDSIQSTNQD